MDIRRRNIEIQDENIHAAKGKIEVRQGLGLRGALGDVNSNIQAQRDANGKSDNTDDKKAALKYPIKSSYAHVQSKIDTGLSLKAVQQPTFRPSARPPLRREESTAGLAARAAHPRGIHKDTQNKPVQPKESLSKKEVKKTKIAIKEDSKDKENKQVAKPKIKDPVESLGRLKLADSKPVASKPIEECSIIPIPTEIQLPNDIEDIDADENEPLLMSTYIKDIYKYLQQVELDYPIEINHLKIQTNITGKMRATLIDWLVDLQRQFLFVLETFHLTVGIIDRYLQMVPNVRRDRLQLIGVTAMYIASKYEEIYPPDVSDFVYVTANAYKKIDVFQCERDILSKLDFRLNRPIPLSFLRRFVKAAHGTSRHHHLAKYFVDLCLVEYNMSHYRPSELAAAAICLSLHLLSGLKLTEVWTPTIQYYSDYSLEHIQPITAKIAKIVINIEKSKHRAVYNKYLDQSLAKVASLPVLKGEAINCLAKRAV